MDLSKFANYDYYLKFLILGDSGVGKSCLLLNFIMDSFEEDSQTTIGIDFKTKTIQNNGKIVKIQVWDTAGQERFKTISKSFYKIANGVILVFDLTSENTFNNIKQWILELNKNTDENIIKILVGNKLDLEKQRKIPYSSAIEFAEKNNMKYIETSNKNHINIDKVFLILVDLIISRIDDYLSTQDNISNIKQIELFSSMDQTEQKSRCCL